VPVMNGVESAAHDSDTTHSGDLNGQKGAKRASTNPGKATF
jgi:hypothetical protein